MKLKDILFAAVLLAGVAAFFFYGRGASSDAHATSAYQGEPEIIAATFSSAWCSSCKILEPRLAKVIPAFSNKPVRFIEFDFTFGKNDSHKQLAADNGFAQVYDRFKSGTGFTLLIDAQTGGVIDTLTINHSKEAMSAAISQAIALASRPTDTSSADPA